MLRVGRSALMVRLQKNLSTVETAMEIMLIRTRKRSCAEMTASLPSVVEVMKQTHRQKTAAWKMTKVARHKTNSKVISSTMTVEKRLIKRKRVN